MKYADADNILCARETSGRKKVVAAKEGVSGNLCNHEIGFPVIDTDDCVKGIAASFLDYPEVAPELDCLTTEVEPFLFGDALLELWQ